MLSASQVSEENAWFKRINQPEFADIRTEALAIGL